MYISPLLFTLTVLGSFSAARMILPYIKVLKDSSYSMNLAGTTTTAQMVYDALCRAIANVYRDVMESGFINEIAHPDEHRLFHNVNKVVDGPCYAFLVHGHGPAVGGQGFELDSDNTKTSSHVTIANNNIDHIRCWTK